jgi:hypothetical protein
LPDLVLRLDVRSSRALLATILALRQTDKAVQANIRKYTKEAIMPEFKRSMTEHASTLLEQRTLVATARATVSNQNITLKSGSVGRALSGGLLPKRDAHAVEFGANRQAKTTYAATSTRGRPFTVSRRTKAQLRPRKRNGYVFFPTIADLTPRILSLWVQTTVRTLAEALEGKRG